MGLPSCTACVRSAAGKLPLWLASQGSTVCCNIQTMSKSNLHWTCVVSCSGRPVADVGLLNQVDGCELSCQQAVSLACLPAQQSLHQYVGSPTSSPPDGVAFSADGSLVARTPSLCSSSRFGASSLKGVMRTQTPRAHYTQGQGPSPYTSPEAHHTQERLPQCLATVGSQQVR